MVVYYSTHHFKQSVFCLLSGYIPDCGQQMAGWESCLLLLVTTGVLVSVVTAGTVVRVIGCMCPCSVCKSVSSHITLQNNYMVVRIVYNVCATLRFHFLVWKWYIQSWTCVLRNICVIHVFICVPLWLSCLKVEHTVMDLRYVLHGHQ